MVIVPPIFEATICPSKIGIGSIFIIFAMVMVIGPIRRTVVTLSKNAEHIAVISMKATIIFHGSPFAIFAALMDIYSKRPECLITATKIIIPTRTPIVLKST